jgi:hypothetical protein
MPRELLDRREVAYGVQQVAHELLAEIMKVDPAWSKWMPPISSCGSLRPPVPSTGERRPDGFHKSVA